MVISWNHWCKWISCSVVKYIPSKFFSVSGVLMQTGLNWFKGVTDPITGRLFSMGYYRFCQNRSGRKQSRETVTLTSGHPAGAQCFFKVSHYCSLQTWIRGPCNHTPKELPPMAITSLTTTWKPPTFSGKPPHQSLIPQSFLSHWLIRTNQSRYMSLLIGTALSLTHPSPVTDLIAHATLTPT